MINFPVSHMSTHSHGCVGSHCYTPTANRTSRSTSLEGITVLADDVVALASFYRDALGLVTVVEEEFYVASGGEGVRLEIFLRPGMVLTLATTPTTGSRSRARRSN